MEPVESQKINMAVSTEKRKAQSPLRAKIKEKFHILKKEISPGQLPGIHFTKTNEAKTLQVNELEQCVNRCDFSFNHSFFVELFSQFLTLTISTVRYLNYISNTFFVYPSQKVLLIQRKCYGANYMISSFRMMVKQY